MKPPASSATRTGQEQRRMFISWMTCAEDRSEHAVTDEAFAAGRERNLGIYQAVCGHQVSPTPMACPPGPRCRACVGAIAITRRRPPPRKTAWSRLLGRRGAR